MRIYYGSCDSGYSLDTFRQGPNAGLHLRSSNSDWGMWTSTVSALEAGMVTAGTSSSICSMGDPCAQGAGPLTVVGGEFPDSSHEDSGGTSGLSAPHDGSIRAGAGVIISQPLQFFHNGFPVLRALASVSASVCLSPLPRAHLPICSFLTTYGLLAFLPSHGTYPYAGSYWGHLRTMTPPSLWTSLMSCCPGSS